MVNPIYPLRTALTELLYAASKTSLVSLRFAPECARCGSAVCVEDRMGLLPSRANCVACGYGNTVDCLDKIKVIFMLNHDVLYTPADNLGCPPVPAAFANTIIFAPVPATYSGSGFSYSSGCESKDGKKDMICPALEPGRYRMRCPISSTDGFLEVERDATPEDTPIVLNMKVSEMLIVNQLKTIKLPHGKLIFEVVPDTRSFSILWVQKDQDEDTMLRLPAEGRTKFASAADVVHHPGFQLLFRSQVVNDGGTLTPHGAALSLGRVVLVFTDIVGSTEMYARVGDGEALKMVRSQYEVLFAAFAKRGRVVKTIGDAIMAFFSSGRDALKAVAEALRSLLAKNISHPDRPALLQIRVGVHAGPCVVVPLNDINDYFGQTVNMAARLEGAARPGECLLTEAMLEDDPVALATLEELMEEEDVAPTALSGTDVALKGIAGPVKVRGFRIAKKKAAKAAG